MATTVGVSPISFTPDKTGVAIALQTGDFTTYSGYGELAGRVDGTGLVAASRAKRYPKGHGKTYSDREIAMVHRCQGAIHAARQVLEAVYSPWLGPGTLLFEEDGVEKTAEVMPLTLVRHSENPAGKGGDNGLYEGRWALLSGIYYSPDPAAATPASVPGTLAVTNAGKVISRRASLTLLANAAKSGGDGQTRRKRITIAATGEREMVDWPICLTPDGWDHAAEVTGSASLSTGDDVEVYVSGVRYPRWAQSAGAYTWNTATTRVWTLLTMPPGRRWYAHAPIGAGDLTLKLRDAADDLPAFPFYAAIEHTTPGTEIVLVTGYDSDARELTIVRARRDTTALSSAAGTGGTDYVHVWWATGIIDLVWGHRDAGTPDYIDNNLRPLILDSATAPDNDAWTFDTLLELDGSDATRIIPHAASWLWGDLADRSRERKTGEGDQYMRMVPKTTGSPATDIGLKYRPLGPAAGQPLVDRVLWRTPRQLSTASLDWVASTLDGDAAQREGVMVVGHIDRDGNVSEEAEYDVNVTAGSGTHAFSFTGAVGLFARYKPYDPQAPGSSENSLALEPATNDGFTISAVEVTFSDAPIIVVSATDYDCYQFGRPDDPATIANTEAETLRLYGPIVNVDEGLTIDIETHALTLDEDDQGRAHLTRGEWPGIPAGTTNLTYAETSGASVTAGASSYDAWA